MVDDMKMRAAWRWKFYIDILRAERVPTLRADRGTLLAWERSNLEAPPKKDGKLMRALRTILGTEDSED